ncbi:amidohydrolase family protein [Subtercola lobariae]|uniref:Amidohydrolase n=1 Tax=Subtercola lobariae TaxID=1588641 RepID=A0A917EWB6_9MICO|nr:amidohydrolase family protein [Subtercola lobariae]GGF15634.1 amidohydrolase [Subtercola lobariae]
MSTNDKAGTTSTSTNEDSSETASATEAASSARIRTVAVEEHFRTPELAAVLDGPERLMPPILGAKLADLGDARIADMDEVGIDVQVLSSAATQVHSMEPQTAISVSAGANDALAKAVAEHPTRFAGLATLATPDPEAAARELERSVTELGFVGAMIYGPTHGNYLDHDSFTPILEAAEALGVPLYLHPTYVPAAVVDAYYSDLPGEFGMMLSTGGMGWHYETAVHAMRLILSGVFQRYPKLQIILGHDGEGIPFYIGRTIKVMHRASPEMSAHVGHAWKNNFYVSTSGFFTDAPFQTVLGTTPIDRILFAMDYPYARDPEAIEWARSTTTLDDASRRKVLHENSDRLFKLTP